MSEPEDVPRSLSLAAVCVILGAILAALLVGYSVYLDLVAGASR